MNFITQFLSHHRRLMDEAHKKRGQLFRELRKLGKDPESILYQAKAARTQERGGFVSKQHLETSIRAAACLAALLLAGCVAPNPVSITPPRATKSAKVLTLPPKTRVTLAWDASPDVVTGYRLYFGPASGNYTNSIATTGLTISLTNIVPVGTNFFAVTALRGTSESAFSEEAFGDIKANTTVTLRIAVMASGSLTGTWREVAAITETNSAASQFYKFNIEVVP